MAGPAEGKAELKREVGLFGAVAYGVGTIIGAGVYALIGPGAGNAGNALWLAFVVAAVVASFTGLCYAKLSSIFPVAGAEYIYVEEAFRSRFWAFLVGWLVIISGIISISAVALGFGGYLFAYTGIPREFIAAALIALLSVVNYLGIKESIIANIVLTIIELVGIAIMVFLGIGFLGQVDYVESPQGFNGIIAAVGVIFFAFIGFEGLVKIGEETSDPTRTIPRALIISLAVSTVLYVLVALAVVSIVPFEQLAASSSPLALVAERAAGPEAGAFLSLIALLSTANTVLIVLVATSRIAYGMSKESVLPYAFSQVHPVRGTPRTAILFTMALAILFAFVGNIEFTANIANYTIFIVFLAVDAALIALWRAKVVKTKGIVVVATLGVVSSLVMLTQFDLEIVLVSLALTGAGALVYRLVAWDLR